MLTSSISLLAISTLLFTQLRKAATISDIDSCEYFRLPKDCEKILACTGYDGASGTNRLDPVKSRALPNQRLVRAFCIDNGFTTSDVERSKAFRREAYGKISNIQDAQWTRIADSAELMVKMAVQGDGGKAIDIVTIDTLIQSLTLKISLYFLFGMDPFSHDDKSISEMAAGISREWQYSKSSYAGVGAGWNHVRDDLRKVFPSVSESTANNPYNLILPAYETMWRAVLFGFIEVAFKDFDRSVSSGTMRQLQQYLANPTPEAFTNVEESSEDSVSVSHVVNEILRRYPPTQRVYRRFHLTGKRKPETVAADIHACHHQEDIWGEDAWEFRPARWKHISERARTAFMPFGGSRFVCPAKQDFGPRMIGLLVAALAKHISGQEWSLFTRDEDEPCGYAPTHVTKETELNLKRGWYWYIDAVRNS